MYARPERQLREHVVTGVVLDEIDSVAEPVVALQDRTVLVRQMRVLLDLRVARRRAQTRCALHDPRRSLAIDGLSEDPVGVEEVHAGEIAGLVCHLMRGRRVDADGGGHGRGPRDSSTPSLDRKPGRLLA